MSQKQRQKLAKEITQVTREYQDRHSHLSSVKNIADLDGFSSESSLPPSSDFDLTKRQQEEIQPPLPAKRQRLSIDKWLALSANHDDENLAISTGRPVTGTGVTGIEKSRSSRRRK